MQGTVKWFNAMKGYGFITPSDGSAAVFVHANDIEGGTLRDGDAVEFEVGEGRKGPKAQSVRVASAPA